MALASMYLEVWSWSRQSPELQKLGKKGRLSSFERGMLLVSEYFPICSVTGIFTHNHF